MAKISVAMFAALSAAACEGSQVPVEVAQCTQSLEEFGEFVSVPSGQFRKGAGAIYPEEGPEVTLHVDGFEIQAHEVTNNQFAAFVAATDYETDAERSSKAGGIAAGSAVFQHPDEENGLGGAWSLVADATWRAPYGGQSDIEGLGDHPVVHVSHADATAYAKWAGGRLPSEIEWEYAAQLSLPDPSRTQSGAYDEVGRPVANTWQGIFPLADTGDDGSIGLAPAGCFSPSPIGLYDMIGNAWEWTATPYDLRSHTVKGGSFLCADNFCQRFRPAARQPQETDFSSNHIGFRIVRDIGAD